MSNVLIELTEKGLVQPPKWLGSNIVYMTIVGSVSYGAEDTSSNKKSDMDIFGVCIPKKEDVFPHLAGRVHGFDNPESFQQWQEHHIMDESALGGKGREYDFSIYSIIKFFKLLMENNPSCIDTLFTPVECILHTTKVGNLIRDNRKLFLHKGCWHKFKGYAYSMLHKMQSKNPQEGSNRSELREKFGYDVKYAMHVVRLLLEAEMILAEGDLDLRRNKEQLKSIRRGEWEVEKIVEWAGTKEKNLEELYIKSSLPYGPDKDKIRSLLLDCLKIHYNDLDNCIVEPDKYLKILKNIKEELEKGDI